MRRALLRAGLLAAGLLSPGCSGGPQAPPPAAPLAIVPLGAPAPQGAAAVARVEVASTPEARQRGLMGRDALPADTGMLFVYPAERPAHFWMRNCRSPLAAAFLDGTGRVLNVAEMAPDDGSPDEALPRYASAGPALYVLEMESGWFARKGIRPGDRADLSEALRGVTAR